MLPIRSVTLPADLAPEHNGKLGPCQLTTMFCAGVGWVSLHPQAKRSFEALFSVALAETGQTLTVVSQGDHYRSVEAQESLFRSRYATNGTQGGCKSWDSNRDGTPERWCKKLVQGKVPATAAVPGTSNHGLGLALDVGIWDAEARKVRGITTNPLLWAWLSEPGQVDQAWHVGTGSHVESFGLSWELQSEPWHLRHCTGDRQSRRVLDIEAWVSGQQ